jgi:hypothetical protein
MIFIFRKFKLKISVQELTVSLLDSIVSCPSLDAPRNVLNLENIEPILAIILVTLKFYK